MDARDGCSYSKLTRRDMCAAIHCWENIQMTCDTAVHGRWPAPVQVVHARTCILIRAEGLWVNRRAIRHWQESERGFKWRVLEELGWGGTRRNQNVFECDKWNLE
ncbi:hypothetical protein CEXT_344001 [Caerostris extrusa]|uniref:Uncharacterized protein n=1 Tax=Caerostris extrusa TaxID=172846 RepID=A0AAV4VX73_CAEEX|nr:hypothetical protein CEXT_344001 [Caerostris extrusa]